MHSVKLQWKPFNVDLQAMEAYVKALAPSCTGSSADAALTYWFSEDPNVIPTEAVTTQQEVITPTAVPTLDEDGEQVVDEDGNPVTHMENVVSYVDVVTQVATGEPSIAQKIEAKWESLSETSAEVLSYATKAQMKAIQNQVAKITQFSTDLLVEFNAENIMMGISLENKTDEVLEVMTPVLTALQSGSPTSAIKRAKAIPADQYDGKYITAARLLKYVNKIEAFLGLSLSQTI